MADGLPGFWGYADVDPGRVAVVDVDASEVTFGALRDRVNQLSHALRELAPQSESTVAIVASNRVDFMTFILAASQVGVYYTPISSHLTASEISYIVADSGAALVFVDAGTAAAAGEGARTAGLGDERIVSFDAGCGLRTLDELIAGRPTTAPPDRHSGVPMLYTSGTSGRPKGVRPDRRDPEPEAAAQRLAVNLERYGIVAADEIGTGVHLVVAPLYHAAPLYYTILALHLGHTAVLMLRFDARESLALIERHAVTWTAVVPTMIKRWLDLGPETYEAFDMSSLRWLIHGAAPCPADVKRRAIEWLGPVVYEYYASTEAGGTSIRPEDWLEHPGSVGRPWSEGRIRILGDDGEDLPAGEAGMIYMRNLRPFVYHNDPDKTDAAMHEDFVTVGDIGYVDDEGYLFLLDRRTDLVISGGVNVYPAEIEAALLAHPDVADAGAVGVPHPDLGQVVRAVVEPREGVDVRGLVDALHAHCAESLGSIKRPREIVIGDVPRSATGKVLRRELRDGA
jgi:long-chain acyl-CoA synthetase